MIKKLLLTSAIFSIFTGVSPVFAEIGNITSPKNVILIIGDGMDDQQVSIARNYLVGANGMLSLDSMPVRSTARVITVDENNPNKNVYVADSANSATSLATGVITSRGRIATSAQSDRDLATIVELATSAGYKAGIVTTASITDATPASFVAHIRRRGCENPSQMTGTNRYGISIDCSADLISNGGNGSIAEQIAVANIDLIFGGGLAHFNKTTLAHDKSVLDIAKNNGYTVITSKQGLDTLKPSTKALGLFSGDTMPVKWRAENNAGPQKPDASILNYVHKYLGDVELPAVSHCENNPSWDDMPSLKHMTDTALTQLSQNNGNGFFLMIESASIDKQSHERNTCGHIGETAQLIEALDSALAFAKSHPDTLILVTADHGHSAQIIPERSMFSDYGIPVFTPGYLTRLQTLEGSIMGVNYASNDFAAEEHSGVNVPIYANKVAKSLLKASVTQAQLFNIMADYLDLLPSDTSTTQP